MSTYLCHLQTRSRTQPSYHSKHTFLKAIDQLPIGPEWKCELVQVHGELENNDEHEATNSEELELWLRDPVAYVRELIGNAAFRTEMAYAPKKVYIDPHGRTRRYDEMWTGNWWWECQVSTQRTSNHSCT